MNSKAFQVVWNHARQCYMVVSEIATRAGKTKTKKSISISLASGASLLMSGGAFADAIIPDGRTLTSLAVSGNVTEITTNTVRGINALNSFQKFNIDNGQTVNLHLPKGASNLLNLVHNEQSVIDGVMNAYKDGRIGGNIFFLNPHGIVVGAGGVLNVGSLTMATPTRQFMDSIIDPSGLINDGAINNVLSGFIPLTESGLIQVKGRINAVDSININAGQVIVDAGSHLIAGMQAQANFGDLVNIDGIELGSEVKIENGVISILAMGDVDVAGQIAADGVEGQNAGRVEILAGQDIHLTAGADISASGQGLDSSGGVVDTLAQRDAVISTGAQVSADAGESGDGGFVEFSAKRTVELAGGTFSAEGHDGLAGEVLIDPENIIISADLLRGASGYGTVPAGGSVAGANLTLLADETITVNADITVSSRLVIGTTATNHADDASIGDSGDITFQASSIKLLHGSKVLANGSADGTTHEGGDVTFTATDVAFDLLGYKEATSTIEVGDDLGGATIKGRNVTLSANALAENKWLLSSGDAEQNAVDLATTALTIGAQALGVKAIYSQANAKAEVIIKAGSLIEATDTVTLEAKTISTAGSDLINTLAGATPLLVNKLVETPLALGGLYARVDANSTVQVDSGTTINAADFTANTHNTADLNASLTAKPKDPLDNDSSQVITIAVGVTEAEVNAKTSISGTLGVSGNVQITAVNNGSYQNEVVGKTGAAGRAAAAVSYATRETDATAELKANVADATKVEVLAVNNVSKDFVSAQATAGLAGWDEISTNMQQGVKSSIKSAPVSLINGLLGLLTLDKIAPKPPANNGTPTEVKFRLSGAIAYADSKDEANASIEGANVNVHATEHIAVNALVNAENTKISAKSSAVSNSSKTQSASDTSRQGYSAGLAIGNYEHNATARVGADVTLTAPQIGISSQTLMPVAGSSTFATPEKTFNRYETLADIQKWVDDRKDDLDPFITFNGVSQATAKANESEDSIALSGSASILNYDSSSRALVDEGAKLNLSKAADGSDVKGPWSTDALEIIRATEAKTIPLLGLTYENAKTSVSHQFDFDESAEVSAVHDSDLRFQGGAIPSSTGSEKGLGIAVNDIDVTSLTEAVVREGVVIQGVTETAGGVLAGTRTWTVDSEVAAPEVNVVAQSKDSIMSITNAAGAGATFGVNGSVSIVTADTTTRALVDDEVAINAKSLAINAISSPVIWSISGGINLSKNASVGVGVAVNDVITKTDSEIADNDTVSTNDAPRTSLLNITGSTITTPELDVIARTSGRVEAIAIAGAIANNAPNADGEPGFMEKIKNKTGYTKVMTFAEGLSGMDKDSATRPRSDSTPPPEPEKEKKPPTYSFAGAGSGAINLTEMSTMAKIEGVTIVQTVSSAADPVSLVVRAISDSDITAASGAAAITRAKDPDTEKTVGIAGSVAVNSIGNGTQAWLKNSTITDAGDVSVQALSGGEQLAVALGMAVDASTGPAVKKSDSFVGSLSLTLAQTDDNGDSKNKTVAKVDNTDITSKSFSSMRDIDVTAYNRTYIGTGGGSLAVSAGSASKGTSIGAAVSWANVRNDVSATIEGNSHILDADSVSVHAYNATEIGAGAAMLGLSKAEGANSFAGSLVVNQITNNTTAAIEKSTVTARGLVDVEARDKGADAALETLIDPDGDRDNTANGLDYCGESAGAASPSGNCIAAVAGTVQLGKGKNFGVSIAYNQIENNLTAKVKDSTVTVTGTAITDRINVIAQSDTSILGVAFGVGASSKMSGAGSLSIAGIENNVFAEVGKSASDGSTTTLTAPTVTITSTDDSIIQTVAGQVNVSTSDKALGAAFAYNEINNDVHSIVDTAMIMASNEVAITAQENAKIETLSASAGLASGTAVSLSASLNFIDNTSEARLSNGTIKDGSTTGGTNTVKITATDGSYETTIDPTNVDPTIEEQLDDQYSIRSIAGSVGGSYSGAGVGAAFSLNQVSNANKVLVENSTIEGAKVFELKALEKAIIRTFAGAVGAGQSGFSGSITLNNIGQSFVGSNPNSTTAELNNSNVSGGAGSSIKVEGTDDSIIESYAGALAIGLSGSAVGGAIADNNIQTTAKGSISNSSISDSASLDVTGLNKAKIKSASIAGSAGSGFAFGGSASSNRTENKTYGEIIGSDITGSTSVVNVKATNESDIQALSGGAAGSFSSAAVGIAISVNDIDDTTSAHVTGKKGSGYAVKDLQVAAASDATIKALSIGAAAGSGIAGAGSVGVSLISSTTSAYIDDGAVVLAENNVGVTAESDDAITVISGSAGLSLGAGGIGVGLNVNSITSNTKAYISGANTSVTGLAKDAGELMDVYNGELTAGVNLENQVDELTFAALDLKNNKATESVSGVAVNASSSQQIENITGTIGASAGIGAGVAAGVNVIGGTTEAYVLNAKINDNNTDAGATQQVDINASNIAYDNSFIVAVGIGANAGGLGIDTHVMNRTTSAKVIGGSINAKDTVAVKAESTQGISSVAAGGAAGGNAGAGTLSLALFENTTEAIVYGTTVTASALEIKAKNTNDMFLMAGAVSIGGNAGGGAFAVGSSDSNTNAKLSNSGVTVNGAVTVDAINKTDINHIVVSGAGGGGNGVAGMADVSLVTDQTLATIENSTIGSVGDKAASVHVVATHTLDVDSKAGALGVGISGGGVGAGASINIIKANTVATVSDSTIYATGLMDVTAVSTKHVDATALTAGVGGTVGIGGAAVVTLVGDDVSGDAAEEVDGSLSAVDDFTSGDKFDDLPDTGTDGPVILSAADKTALNSDTNKSTTDVTGSAGGFTFKTAAEIKGTNTINSGSLDVIATDKTDTKTLVGGFGASLGGGIGGGVAVTNVKANVAANVSGTALTTNGNINVKATADNDTGKTIEILALAGGAGLVGIGAAVSFADISNNVDANLSSGADAGTGTVTVSAEDKTDIESDAKGAAVGAAAAGAVYSETSKNSTINAAVGGIITAASANISASDSGFINSLGQSAAGGLGIGLSGAFVDASDDSTITALTATNTTFNLGSGALNVTATSTPRTEAEADGIAVSGGLAIGASIADASINTTINATLGSSNTVNAGGFNLTAQQLRSGTKDSAKSTAWAASGGLLLGASATTSDADAVVNVNSRVGDNSTLNLGSGTATVTASVDSKQSAIASGINVGFVAAGFNDATATSANTIYASLGSGVKVTAGTLNINSGGSDNNFAEAIAGSGGVLAGSASEGKTISYSDTRAYIESSTAGRDITVNNFKLEADHTAAFNSTVDSTNASVVGASGAFADNFNDANVWVGLGNGVNVSAYDFDINAYNRTRKILLGNDFNVVSASGGLFDAAATHTASIVWNDTDVVIGEGVTITSTGGGVENLSIKAMNDVELYDSAKMDSGGAVALAKAEAFVYNDQNDADIALGQGTVLTSNKNIVLESLTTAIADSEVNSKTYGLAGAAEGHSISRIDTSNNILLNGARLETDEDVILRAGHNNDLNANAETRIYNRTLIPAETDPDADGIITQNNKITVNAYVPKVGISPTDTTSEDQIDRAAIATVKDIYLQAGEGVHTTRGYGTGTDLYREIAAEAASLIGITLSTEVKGGSVSDNSVSSAEVNGTLFAGTHFHQILEIEDDGNNGGNIIQQSEGMASPTYRYNVNLARDIDTRIAALQLLVNEYQADNPDIANGFKADIDILNAKRSRLGVGVTATFMDIGPAVANTGYIYATGDSLIGTGEILAPGDAKIEIINRSNAFVSIGKYAGVDDTLFIPGDLGGVITLNGVRVSNKDEIDAINQHGQTAGFTQILDRQTSEEPVISITNLYEDPINLNALNPEVHIDGDITNIRGKVEINSAGSVQVSSNILAKTIVINTKGDFIKTFTTGFTHQGGDPTLNVPNRYGPAEYTAADGKVYPYTLDLYYEDLAKRLYPNSTLPPASGTTERSWADVVNTPALSSVIAGQNVFISGEKLNINGLIQSGLPSFDVNITQSLAQQAIDNNGDWTSVGMRENGELVADLFSPKIRWNSVTEKIELQSLAIGGGYMQLYGDIFSTGNGRLKVLDGYGQIEINNTSNKNLTVNRLDTGTGVEGMIKITDTSTKNLDGKPLTTIITLENDVVKYTYENPNSDALSPEGVSYGASRTGVYNPRADRRLEWLDANTQDNDLWASYTKSCYAGCSWFAGDLLAADPGTRTGGDQTITDYVRPSGELLVDYNYAGATARPDYKLDYTKVISPVVYTAEQTDHYWTDTCVLGICVDDMEYFETTRRWIWKESNYYLHSLNASKGIDIEFTGFNEGLLTVNNGSKALDLQGAVRNLTGTTTLIAKNISSAETVIINAKDLNMTANAGSIGSASLVNDGSTYLKVNLQTDGTLDARATGSAAIWEQDGQLAIKRAQAGGIINLKADGDLLNAATGVAVSGSSIRLTSVNGAIGTDTINVLNIPKAMLVNTTSATGNLAASAAKDIAITESTGDLRLDTVTTLAGDVTLTAIAGNIIDDDSEFRVDLETEAELLAVADRAGLFGTKAQDSEDNSVNGYNQAKEQDYATYWQMRNVTKTESETYVADAYDAGYVFELKVEDVTELTDLGWTTTQIDDYKTRQTNLYHAANAKFGAEPYNSEFTYSGIGLDADNVEYAFSDAENLAVEQEYNAYWQLRNVSKDRNDTYSADAYSAAYEFTLTDAQKTDLKTNNGWSDQQVAQYEDSKTSSYHEAHTQFEYSAAFAYHLTDDQKTNLKDNKGWTDLQITAYEDSKTTDYHDAYTESGETSFISGFNYDVATQDVAAYELLTDGTWTNGEVTNLVSAGIFKDTPDTEVLIENDNILGHNITLNASGGIGAEKSARVISYVDPSSWDAAERLALVAADRNDVIIDNNNKTFTIRVKDDIDLSLQNSGELTAHAGSDIYIGSEADIRVKDVVAQNNGDVRIKTGAALINVATVGASAITGGNVTVEAGGSDLGSDATPFILNALGSLTARADGDLFVNNTIGDMRIEQVYATNLVKLISVGGILENPYNHNLTTDIQATKIDLTAVTTIGQADATGLNYLDIGSDNDGWVDMSAAEGIYVYSPAYRLNLRDVTASNGSVNVTSAVSSLDVVGSVTGKNGITLDSAEAVWLTEAGHLESSDGDINISTSGYRKVAPSNYFDPVDNTLYGFKMDTTSSINSLLGEISISSVYDMLVGPLTGMRGVSLESTLGDINQLAATQINATNGDVDLQGVGVNILDVNTGGAATVIAGVNGINVQGSLQASDEIDMSSTDSIEVLDGAKVQTTLAINLRANDDISLTGGKVVTTGAITLVAGQYGTGQILVEAQSADELAINSGATLDMTAANNIVIQGKTQSVGDTHFAAGDDLHLAGGSLVTQGAVTFTAGTDGSGDLLVDKEKTGVYAVDTTSTLDMTAANEMLIKGRIRALGNTNLTANDDVRFAGGSLTTDEPLNVTAGEDGTGSIYIETTSTDSNTLQTAKQMVLTAADDITIDGNLRGDEGLEFNAGNAVNIISGSVYTNDKVNIASNESLSIGGELFGGLGVNLSTPNDIVFNGGSIGSDGDVTIKAGTDGSGSVLGDSAAGTDIIALGILDIQAPDSIGGESALETQVATQANFRASDINVDVTNKPLDHSLLLSVSDIGGGPSNSVMMNVTSNNAVYFDTFNAVTAEVTVDAPNLKVSEGSITNYAVFNMPLYSTRFDTLSRDVHPGYDVNAYTIDGNFTFNGLASSVDVGSYIINRNPLLEWTGDVPADVVSASNEVMQAQPAGNTPLAQDPKKINVWGSAEDLAKNLYSGVTLVSVSGDWFNAITSTDTQAKPQNPENIEEIEINENN